MATITVQPEYGYVVLTAVGTCFLGFWHGGRVGSFRKAAGVGYPCPYADSAQMSAANPETKKAMYLFNCAQRAHGNFLENHTTFLFALLVAGLRYPVSASVMGGVWSVGRLVYALGYTRNDKEGGKGRLAGAFFWLAQLGLYVQAGLVGYNLAF